MNTRLEGTAGENVAEEYLKNLGYKILERNFTAPHGEIDIVAKEGKYIVFVEVKRRKTSRFGLPPEAVTVQKQRVIAQCAAYWLAKNKLYGAPVRFDVVGILDDDVTLIRDAFRP